MKNVEMTVEGETLIIKVDLSKDFGPSKSGKTIMIASTEGNVSVPDRDDRRGQPLTLDKFDTIFSTSLFSALSSFNFSENL